MRAGAEEERACLACHIGAIGADEPTLLVKAYIDSMSDDNLIPEQWLVVLRGEGVEPVQLAEPIRLTWGIARAEIILRAYVDIAVRVLAWAGQAAAAPMRFYVSEGDGDAITVSWKTMKGLKISADLEALVAAQRALGLTLTCPSPRGDPPVQDMDGRDVSLSEREVAGSERERLVEEARSVKEPLDADFVDPAAVPKDVLFIGRHSLEHLREELMASGVFQPELERGGESTLPPMEIRLKEGFVPPVAKGGRRYAPRVQAALDEEIARQLRLGVIEECDDPPAQEVVMVRKDDAASGFRFTLDARGVNAGMVTEPCNPPPIPEVLRGLAGCRYLARLDLASAYWQFPVIPECRPLSAFRVGHRVYRYCVVWMGGAGASHFVQRGLHMLLQKYIGNGIWVYIDDIVIAAETAEEFIALVRYTVAKLKEARLICKLPKCVIGCFLLRLLGHIVDGRFVRIADDRREEVARLPFPENPKQLRAALGQANFQRSFIPNYAVITKPLTSLVNGSTAQMRTPEARAAWAALMAAVAGQLSLAHLDYKEQIRVRVDSSIVGVGGALFNVGKRANGETWERLVAVCSHAYTEAERNWATIEQEAFAMVFACRYWLPLLSGIRFVLDGDHKNLQYIHGGTSPKVIRWGLFMQSLDCFYNHIAGIDNFFPDRLSRQDFARDQSVVAAIEDFQAPDSEVGEEKPARPAKQRVSRAFRRAKKRAQEAEAPAAEAEEGSARAAPEELAAGSVESAVDEATRQQRIEWIRKVHNNGEGHHGIHRTVWMLQEAGHHWPKMGRDVAEFIETCISCQKNRPQVSLPSAPRGSMRQYTLFAEVAVDFIGPLPTDQLENSYICGITCLFSSYLETFAVEAASAVCAAHCLLSVIARYTAPWAIRSDRGTHFVNEIIEELYRVFVITGVFTPPYRPQANSMEERNGGESMRHLRALTEEPEAREIWSVILPLPTRIVNNTYKWWLGCRPNDLVYLVPPSGERGLFDPFRPVNETVPVSTEFMTQLRRAYEVMLDATSNRILAEQRKLERVRAGSKTSPVGAGDLVLIRYPARPPSKLHERVAGPFQVVQRKGNLIFAKDLTSERVLERDAEMVIPFLQPYPMSQEELRKVAARDMNEVGVTALINHRGTVKKRAAMEFQVQWDDGEITWEPWDVVKKLEALDKYIKDHPQLKALAGRKTLGGV